MKPLNSSKSELLGKQPITKLLIKQAVPASIGILVMSLNILVDSFFVGNWISSDALAAVGVVLPISFFVGALGMAIGIGGSSIISRALGSDNKTKAQLTLGNMLALTIVVTAILTVLGLLFIHTLVPAFGGRGVLFEPASIYCQIVFYGIPFLSLCMMGNNVIRAEGAPTHAMIAMLIPSVGNLFLDYILINVYNFGMAGAAWATTASYFLCFSYVTWFFLSGRSELNISLRDLIPDRNILKEIGSLGFVTLARQATSSIIFLIMNNILFELSGADGVAVFRIIGAMMMFAIFPVLGVTQGFLPIAGFNYGAQLWSRVREVIYTSIKISCILGALIFMGLFLFTYEIAGAFTDNINVIEKSSFAMKMVFLSVPFIAIQLIGAAYYQAIGKAIPALLLTLLRMAIILIPLLLILPGLYGELGVWISFPIADVFSTIITAGYLWKAMKKLKIKITG
ncbi:MATE family efflux transporter [uncultured Nonlabens sp.]|uniref:MATE family efflux transporter n=1 Tax=uncultured Nonlabens sp. TaxID=859306 RepID=UPI00261C4D37|nr:MATE family efflux transporter [uncultured Nonlabens sp.]